MTIDDVAFRYGERVVLDGLSCSFDEGRVTGVVGPSGSGKSTLLALVVGVERPHHGRIDLPDALLRDGELQRDRVAWMTQAANLMLRRSAIDNVMLPLRVRGVDDIAARSTSVDALGQMGLAGAVARRCAELSGGERQRVAMARTLAAGTPLLVADEPTSSLDRANRRLLLDGLRTVARSGTIVVVATHDPEVVEACDTVVDLVPT